MFDIDKIMKVIDGGIDSVRGLRGQDSDLCIWREWYKGFVPTFHNYQIYNGRTRVNRTKLSMQGGKMVCRAWATLIMNERVKIGLKDKSQTKQLAEDYNNDDFYSKVTQTIEQAFALSEASMSIDFSNLSGFQVDEENSIKELTDADIMSTTFNAWNTVPLEIIDNEITQVAFVKELSQCMNRYILHIKNEQGLYDMVYVDRKKDNRGNQNSGKVYYISMNSPVKLFTVFYPNEVNNLQEKNRHISILANAIPILKALDNTLDGIENEIQLGKKRLFISAKLSHYDYTSMAKGARPEKIETFDANDTMIYALPCETSGITGADGQKELIHETSGALRIDSYKTAIQVILNLLSKNTGLGNSFFKFDSQGGQATATQVISENSDTFNNLKRHESVVGNCIIGFTRAWMFAKNTFNKTNYDIDQNITIDFDDSIIKDKGAQKQSDIADVNNGVMSKVEYRMKWYNETESVAKKNISKYFGEEMIANKLTKFSDAYNSGLLSAELFVKLVFGDSLSSEEQAKLIAYLENKKASEVNSQDIQEAFNSMGAYHDNNDDSEEDE